MRQILIIDDDASVGLTFTRMLEGAGYGVSRAESAADGLSHLESHPVDAVILDMRMPEMNGLEFLRRLRDRPAHRSLPVGVITGDYFLKDEVMTELESLGVAIRYKPIWMEDLLVFTKSLVGEEGERP